MYVRKYHRTLWSRVRTTYGLYVSLSRTKVHYALRGTKSDSWGTQGVHRRRQVYHTYKSGVWTKIYLRHERWDLIWSDLIWSDLRLKIMGSGIGKHNRIFRHVGRLFLPGMWTNVPCSFSELWANFREESSGIGQFCRLEVPTDGQWPSFDQ